MFTIIDSLEKAIQLPDKPKSLAIGIFDGIHQGHAKLLSELKTQAGNNLAGVLTFAPHPTQIIRPQNPTQLIYPIEQRIDLIKELGLDFVIIHPFTLHFSQTEASVFMSHLWNHLPQLELVSVGKNFHFGHKRSGNADTLKAFFEPLGVAIPTPEYEDDEGHIISSSRIRALIQSGNIQEANTLLYQPYHGCVQNLTTIKDSLSFEWSPKCSLPEGKYQLQINEHVTTATYQNKLFLLNKKTIIENDCKFLILKEI